MEALPELSISGFDVLDRLPEAISIIGPDGIPLHTNAAARAILDDVRSRQEGLPTSEVSWGALDAFGEPLPNEQLPVEITRMTGAECSEIEVGLPDAEGRERWLRISTRRLSDQGPCFAVVASFVDVSAARRTRDELDRERSRYRTVVESLHEGVIMLDVEGQIIAANATAGGVLGLTREQLLGRTSIDPRWHAIHPDGSPWPAEDHAAQRVRATGRPQLDLLMGVHRPGGPLRWLRVNADVAMYQAKAAGRDRTSTRPRATPDLRAAAASVRVLHCDESGPYRRLVELMLESYPDINLVGSVSAPALAVEEAHRLRPDVVLLDACTPGNIDNAIAAIKTVAPGCRVAVLSALDEPSDRSRQAADGFILKTRTFDSIAEAIRALRANRA